MEEQIIDFSIQKNSVIEFEVEQNYFISIFN